MHSDAARPFAACTGFVLSALSCQKRLTDNRHQVFSPHTSHTCLQIVSDDEVPIK